MLTFGSLKILINIGIPLSFSNFGTMVVQFGLKKKNKLEVFKSSHNGHQYSKLLLVKSVHRIRNEPEERLCFLNIRLAGIPGGRALESL